MKLTIILTAMLFISGCTGVSYYHIYNGGEVVKINYNNANAKYFGKDIKIVLPDGAEINFGERTQEPNAASAEAIGKAIGAGIGAATVGGMLR